MTQRNDIDLTTHTDEVVVPQLDDTVRPTVATDDTQVEPDYARGLREEAEPVDEMEGDFAEGMRADPPPTDTEPDFARGQRTEQADEDVEPDFARGMRQEDVRD